MTHVFSFTQTLFARVRPLKGGTSPAFVLGIPHLFIFLLQGCAVNLNNPQVSQSGFLSPIDTPSSPSVEEEETFMPVDHVRIRPSTDRTQINSSITFTAEGGLTPYLFSLNDGSGVLDSISGAFTAPATPGFAIVEVKDEAGSNDRATVLFKDPPLLTPTPTSIAVGNSLRIGAVGGTRPYLFAVTQGNEAATYISETGILLATAAGTAELTLTDADGQTAVLSLSILPALTLGSTGSTVGFGATLTLTAAGGVPPISYRVAAGDGAVSSASDTGVTYTAPAITGASVIEAKDALGNTSLVLLQVTPPLVLTPNRSLVQVGQTRDLVASGGSAPYVMTITAGGGNLTQNGVSGTFTAAGSPGVSTVTVSDSKGLTATADIETHPTLNFTADAVDLSTSESIQLTATGGFGALTYSVVSGGGSITPAGDYTAPATPTTARIRVTDSAPTTPNEAEVTVRVFAPLEISPATLILMSGTSATLGATGGLPPYSYSVVGDAGDSSIEAGTSRFTAGSTAGAVQVQVTDARGTTDINTLTIVAALSFTTPSQNVAPDSTTPISTSGGQSPVNLSLSAGPGSLLAGSFQAPSTNGITILKAEDALGNVAFATVTTTVPLSITPSSIDLPGSGSLSFVADGGTPPYTFSIPEGSLGDIAPTSGLFLAPIGSGNTQVLVTDAAGATATATIGVLPDIRITSPASGSIATTGVTISGHCELGISVEVAGSGTTSTQTLECTDGTFSTFVPFTSGDGNKQVTASQTSGTLTQTSDRIFERVNPIPSETSIELAGGAVALSATSVAVTLSALNAAEVYLTEIAGCASGGSWQTYSTNLSFAFTARNSTVTIYAKFRNADLNEGSCISDSITHDSIAPNLNLTAPSDGALTQGSLSVAGNCETGLSVAVSGSGVSSSSTLSCLGGTFSGTVSLGSGDGSKTITYTQTDSAGNASTVSHTYIKDATAPTSPTLSPASGSSVGASTTLSGSCETGTGLVVAGAGITGGPHSFTCTGGTYSQAISFTAGSGSKAISVTSTDEAGNNATTSITLLRDATAPTLTLTSHTSGAEVLGTLTLAGACETGASNVTLTGTGLTPSPETASCTSGAWSKAITLSAGEGAKVFDITQSDAFSNSTTLNISLTKDTVAPTLSFSPDPDGTSTTGSLSIAGVCEAGRTLSISGTGVSSSSSLTCSGSGTFSGTLTLSSGDGAKAVGYSSSDSAGNITSISHTYTRDTANPIAPTTGFSDGESVGATPTLAGSCEAGTQITITGSGVSGTPMITTCGGGGTWSQAITLTTGDGSKAITVTSTDAAGNTNSTALTLIKDTTGPALTVTSPADGATVPSTATLTGACETGGSSISISGTGVSTTETATCSAGSWTKSIALSASDGAKSLTIAQTDSVTNITSLSLSLTLDSTPPWFAVPRHR